MYSIRRVSGTRRCSAPTTFPRSSRLFPVRTTLTIRRFPFGFLFSELRPRAIDEDDPEFTHSLVWNRYHLVYRAESNVQIFGDDDLGMVWIGYGTSVDPAVGGGDFAPHGFRSLMNGVDAFNKSLDYVVGRWAIIVSISGKLSVYNDTIGMQPVYISHNSLLIGSHLPLVSRELDLQNHEQTYLSPIGQLKMPEETEDDRVLALVPNFAFDLHESRLRRYYPRTGSQLESTSPSVEIPWLLELANRSFNYWKQLEFKLYSALTAGLDSRMNVAAALGAKCEVTVVSYGSEREASEADGPTARSYKIDVQVSKKIAEELSIPSVILPIEQISHSKLTDDDKDILRQNTVGSHAVNFQGLYETYLGQTPSICFVGAGYELLSEYYVGSRAPLNQAEEFQKVFGAITGRETRTFANPGGVKTYEEYWEALEYDTVANCGFSIGNMLFWEIRASRFQSEAINCQATAFLPINPLAIRKLFEVGLGLPFEQRKDRTFAKQFIATAYPPLAGYPLNGKPFHALAAPSTEMPPIYRLRQLGDKTERQRQTLPSTIRLSKDLLNDGSEVFYRDKFRYIEGSIRLTYKNNYHIGRQVRAVVHYVRCNERILAEYPIGDRNDPHTVVIDGLRQGDILDFGLKSTRTNGVAWSSVSRTEIHEWTQSEHSTLGEIRISSSRNFTAPQNTIS